MTTVEQAARLLTSEVEDCIALLGNRLVGGGLRVDSIRVALGQTGEVAEDESFLLATAAEGRPGWAVEVRLLASDAVQGTGAVAEAPTAPDPLQALRGRPCTVLRGTDADTAALLAGAGIRTVDELALLPEARLGDLRIAGAGMRLVDSWSKAQLLRVPLPQHLTGELASRTLAEVAAVAPSQLRALGLPLGTTDAVAEELARIFALLGGCLDIAVLRALTVGELIAGG